MASDEFREGLNELLELAERERPAIMCSEAVPWRCHRRLITDALIVAGAEVVNIMSAMSIIEDVREAVIAIPAGSVASYGDIGNRIGSGPRQVARAMGLLGDSVPWWRVVHADGTPATCHDGRAPGLLNGEGTPMLGGRVDMKRARQRWMDEPAP